MPQFFISADALDKDIITISDKENYHHIVKVLRSKIGETLFLIDENRTQYKVVIKNIDSKSITTKVVDVEKSNHYLNLQLYLTQSIHKTKAQNIVKQKETELIKNIIMVLVMLLNCIRKQKRNFISLKVVNIKLFLLWVLIVAI